MFSRIVVNPASNIDQRLSLSIAPTGSRSLLHSLHCIVLHPFPPQYYMPQPSCSIPCLRCPCRRLVKIWILCLHRFTAMSRSLSPFWGIYQSQAHYRNGRSRTILGLGGEPYPPLDKKDTGAKSGQLWAFLAAGINWAPPL